MQFRPLIICILNEAEMLALVVGTSLAAFPALNADPPKAPVLNVDPSGISCSGIFLQYNLMR